MNRIFSLRKKLNLNQTILAKKIGVSQSTLSYWERGDFEPDNESIIKLADFFDVTTDYLLGRTNDPSPPNEKRPVYDDEAMEILEQMHKRPELRVLFSTTRTVKREDIELVNEMIKRMAGQENEEEGY